MNNFVFTMYRNQLLINFKKPIMKKLILSLLAIFVFSFSFAQKDKVMPKKDLMKNSKIAIEYLKKELKLKGTKLASVSEAWNTYAENMFSLTEKIAKKNASIKDDKKAIVENKKAKFKMMEAFMKKRDKDAQKGFSDKQIQKYRELSRSIHPFTLQIKQKKKK